MKEKIIKIKPIKLLLLIIITIILLIYSLGYEKANFFIKYFSYLFSSIILVMVIMNFKRFINYLKEKILSNKIYKKFKESLYKHKYIRKYMEDVRYRNLINLCFSSIFNFSFIMLKFINGISNKSIWIISLAIYYFVIILIKLYLLSKLRKYDDEKGYSVYKKVGYLLMLLNIILIVMIIQMISSDILIVYDDYIAYLTATYTFYLIISATINVIKYRKYNNPLLSSIKCINLVSASVSILMLQVALISTFGEDQELLKLMNTITGTFVSFIILGISLYMVTNEKRFRK